jgi:hypothetical protein
MMRKLLLVSLVVIMRDKPVACVIIVNFSSLTNGVLLGWIQPFSLLLTNYIELINEFFILLANYHLFCFTDFVGPLGKEFMGNSLIYVSLLNFSISIGSVLLQSAFQTHFKIKKFWYQQR